MRFTDRERELIQNALCDRILSDHRNSVNPLFSAKMSEAFAKDCEEKHDLFKKLGGRETVEELVAHAKLADEKVERFVRDRRISL